MEHNTSQHAYVVVPRAPEGVAFKGPTDETMVKSTVSESDFLDRINQVPGEYRKEVLRQIRYDSRDTQYYRLGLLLQNLRNQQEYLVSKKSSYQGSQPDNQPPSAASSVTNTQDTIYVTVGSILLKVWEEAEKYSNDEHVQRMANETVAAVYSLMPECIDETPIKNPDHLRTLDKRLKKIRPKSVPKSSRKKQRV